MVGVEVIDGTGRGVQRCFCFAMDGKGRYKYTLLTTGRDDGTIHKSSRRRWTVNVIPRPDGTVDILVSNVTRRGKCSPRTTYQVSFLCVQLLILSILRDFVTSNRHFFPQTTKQPTYSFRKTNYVLCNKQTVC